MIKTLSAAFVAAAALTLLPATAAAAQSGAPPTPGGCVDHFQRLYVGGGDYPGAPQHKDKNGDGYLCYNGHAWQDNR